MYNYITVQNLILWIHASICLGYRQLRDFCCFCSNLESCRNLTKSTTAWRGGDRLLYIGPTVNYHLSPAATPYGTSVCREWQQQIGDRLSTVMWLKHTGLVENSGTCSVWFSADLRVVWSDSWSAEFVDQMLRRYVAFISWSIRLCINTALPSPRSAAGSLIAAHAIFL